MNKYTQKQKSELFHKLHHACLPLILPNIWEPIGALMLEDIGFPAVATSSSAIALTHGFHDGENISFREHLHRLRHIACAVSIPVTADIEKGYANSDTQLEENVEALIEAGIIGINIEDTHSVTNQLLPVSIQTHRINLIKQTAKKRGIALFVNARIDAYVHGDNLSHEEKLQETLIRGAEYKQAGADCIFPILLNDTEHISTIASEIDIPLNIMVFPGVPEIKELKNLGVARISAGGSFLKIAMQAMKDAAVKLKNEKGMEDLLKTEITSAYLNMLIDKKNIA